WSELVGLTDGKLSKGQVSKNLGLLEKRGFVLKEKRRFSITSEGREAYILSENDSEKSFLDTGNSDEKFPVKFNWPVSLVSGQFHGSFPVVSTEFPDSANLVNAEVSKFPHSLGLFIAPEETMETTDPDRKQETDSYEETL